MCPPWITRSFKLFSVLLPNDLYFNLFFCNLSRRKYELGGNGLSFLLLVADCVYVLFSLVELLLFLFEKTEKQHLATQCVVCIIAFMVGSFQFFQFFIDNGAHEAQ